MRRAQAASYDAVFIRGNGVKLFVDEPSTLSVEILSEEDYK